MQLRVARSSHYQPEGRFATINNEGTYKDNCIPTFLMRKWQLTSPWYGGLFNFEYKSILINKKQNQTYNQLWLFNSMLSFV